MTTVNWLARARSLNINIRDFVEGKYQDVSADEKTLIKYSPRDGSVLYRLNEGSNYSIDQAVKIAKRAFVDGRWRDFSMDQRKLILYKLADLVERHRDEFALYEALDVGKPIAKALEDDISRVSQILRKNIELADKLFSPSRADGSHFGYQLRKPIGVVGGIVGWNYPLTLAVTKVAPALMMGNSLVLKPSELSSLSASRLAELGIEAGIPSGVFNVVHGAGATVGASLAQHPDVDLLTFTGSSGIGKKMMIASGSSNMKRLNLECGGKSAYLVFDDCPDDFDALAADIVSTAFANQGALCVAGTRVLIHDNIKDKLLPKIIEQTGDIKPGDPLNVDTTFGAMIDKAHMTKVLSYIESGKLGGAKLVYGGKRIDVSSECAQGYYIEPTIFTHVSPSLSIAQEEIFGPVLSVFTFKNESEAISLANNSCFGLAAYAATQNLSRAHRLAQKLNVGRLYLIGTSTPGKGGVDMTMEPQKESGLGSEGGLAGLAAYTVSTSVHILT